MHRTPIAAEDASSGSTPSWLSPVVPSVDAHPGTAGGSAAACGTCHTEIYAEWKVSTHAHAWTDPQFQAELKKDPEVAWLCINCHTPLANQQADLHRHTGQIRKPERRPNLQFDAALQQEGVTCLTCHWRAEGIAAAHPDVDAPHPTVYAPELRSEATCTGCHQAVARLEDALVCTFNTGAEWIEAAPGRTCPECHMPSVSRASAAGAPVRSGGRHTFPGSLIPKAQVTDDERARMAVDWSPGVELRLEAPPMVVAGESLVIAAAVENVRGGHRVPTGDPERYLELTVSARDATGVVLAVEQLRIGQVWEWWPVARKVSDNRLAPGESMTLSLLLPSLERPVTIEASLDHVRISPANAQYHDLGAYPARRRIDVIQQAVSLSEHRHNVAP